MERDINVVGYVYFWHCLCVSLPRKFLSYCKIFLTIGKCNYCLNINYSGTESLGRTKRPKLELKISDVIHKKNAR